MTHLEPQDPNDPAVQPVEDPTNADDSPATSSPPQDPGAGSPGPDGAKPGPAPT
jgi:hypothetical protein